MIYLLENLKRKLNFHETLISNWDKFIILNLNTLKEVYSQEIK